MKSTTRLGVAMLTPFVLMSGLQSWAQSVPTVLAVTKQATSGGSDTQEPLRGPKMRLAENEPEPMAAKPGQMEPWQIWAKEPISAPLILEATAKAASGTQLIITVGGQNYNIDGVDCDTETSTNRFYPQLKLYEAYHLSLSGTSWAEAKIAFKSYTPRQLLSARGARAIPRPYKVFINGEEVNELELLEITFNCSNNSTNLSLELRPDRGLRPAVLSLYEEEWSRDEDQNTESSPGDGEWPEIGPGRSTNAPSGAFRWAVSLGQLRTGYTAGKVRLRDQLITSNLFNGALLSYTARSTNTSELHVLTNANGSLRQIRAPQALLDIQSTNSPTEESVLKFYILANVGSSNSSGGLYPILTNSAFATWRIRNPESPGTYRRFQVVEERPSSRSYTNEISYDSTNKIWKLTYGSGNEQRIETRAVGITNTVRQETVQIASPTNTVYKAIETYKQFAWGWELTNVVTNPDGNALTNAFVFFDDTSKTNAYGKLKERWYPGGRWELYRYPYDAGFYDYQCADWPIGDYLDYYDRNPYLWYLAPPSQIRIRPWKDGPQTPGEATLDTVVFTETTLSSGISVHDSHDTRELAFDASGLVTLLDEDRIADGDFNEPEGAVFAANDYRFRGSYMRTVRYRATGSYLHDLVGSHSGKTRETDLFEYAKGHFNWTNISFTVDDTNGVDFAKIKTSGIWNVAATAYPYGLYSMELYFGGSGHSDAVITVLGKSTQELSILQNGNPVYVVLLGMTGITNINTQDWPIFKPIERRILSYDSLSHLTNAVWIDSVNTNISRVIYQSSWRDANGNDTEFKAWETDALGQRSNYAYDSQKRLTNMSLVGVAASNPYPEHADVSTNRVFDAMGRLTKETVTGGSSSLSRSFAYDLAGRITMARSLEGITNFFTFSADTRTTTNTFPGAVTKITTTYLDGQVKSVTGTSVVPEYHDYRIDYWPDDWIEIGFQSIAMSPKLERVYQGTNGSPRWKEQGKTIFGQLGVERMPAFSVTNGAPPLEIKYDYLDNPVFELIDVAPSKIFTPATEIDGSIEILEESNNWGEVYGSAVPHVRRSGYGSDTREQGKDTLYEFDGTNWFSTTFEWRATGSGTTRTNFTRQRLTGFSSNTVLSDATITDSDGNVSTVTITLDQSAKKVTAVTNTPQSQINITDVRINGLLESSNSESIDTPCYIYYDGLRREIAIKDPLGFFTGKTYDAATGWVTGTTNAAGKITTSQYYSTSEANAGKLKCRIDPNGRKTYYDYDSRGRQTRLWSDVPYPEERIYDSTYGDLTELHTFRGGSSWSSASWPGASESFDKSTWNYDPATGLVLSKVDAANRGYTNVYHSTRTLWTKTLARGVTITNTFNVFGEILRKDYSDGTPSVLINNYDPLGKPYSVVDAFGTLTFDYNYDGELITATYGSDSVFYGLALTNRIHSLYGHDQLVLDSQIYGQEFQFRTELVFDTATGRHQDIKTTYWTPGGGNGVTDSTTYAYSPNSDLTQTITAKYGSTPVLTTSKAWDYGYRLGSTRSVLGTAGALVTLHSYNYDDVGRRIRATLEDSSAWNYDYNDRNEVIVGVRYWADQVPVAGQQFEYAYDPVGNRKTSKRGGDDAGAGRLSITYSVNNLNQYTNLANPGALDVIGVANAPATVTVNGQACYENGEYYWKSLTVTNGSAPQYPSITNTATQGSSTSVIGRAYVPPSSETLLYDADGNITNDGRWTFTWDGENRLARMETLASAVSNGVPRIRLDCGYDWEGRRQSKAVLTNWNGSVYQTTNTTRFLYDRWNLIADLAENNTLIRAYAWGVDLGGGLEEEGSIGGMVEMLDYSTGPPSRHFAVYDGNGNVVGFVKSDQTISARYEYGPFGEMIRSTGPLASKNPIRWSSRYQDTESDLTYFGYRYYDTRQGRWLGRDLIEEADVVNLYAYVKNRPIGFFDRLGMLTGTAAETEGSTGIGLGMALGIAFVGTIALNNMRDSAAIWNAAQVLLSSRATTDANDNWEEDLQALNIAFAGQLANNIPGPNDNDKNKGIRRSSKGGDNQAQNKIVDGAAKEAGLNAEGREMLRRWIESVSRGGDKSPTYQEILEVAKELVKSPKYGG